jgi:hypothetical protein
VLREQFVLAERETMPSRRKRLSSRPQFDADDAGEAAVEFVAGQKWMSTCLCLARLRRADSMRLALTSGLIPSVYLGLHLTLGLLLTAAVIVFVALAQDVLAGGEMARFDVATARALNH